MRCRHPPREAFANPSWQVARDRRPGDWWKRYSEREREVKGFVAELGPLSPPLKLMPGTDKGGETPGHPGWFLRGDCGNGYRRIVGSACIPA